MSVSQCVATTSVCALIKACLRMSFIWKITTVDVRLKILQRKARNGVLYRSRRTMRKTVIRRTANLLVLALMS